MVSSAHRISVPSILNVGKDNLSQLGKILLSYNHKNVVLFIDDYISNLYGKTIETTLKSSSINYSTSNYDDINIENIINTAFSIPSQTQVIVGMGGGKILDCAKYISFLRNIPFVSIPTSASNDGFSSSTCSLLVANKRTTVPARIPFGIIIDIEIIKNAPEKFILSGVGDLVSKITALYDWQFEQSKGFTKVDDVALMITKKSINSFVRTQFTTTKDDFFIKELIDSLVMNGIASEIAQSSAPVSGSEHLISHALDKILEEPQLHGLQVGIATYLMSKVQEHRFIRIEKVLHDTGFFDYAKTLQMKKSTFIKAIDLAPSIKPNRHTYIHEEIYREKAKELLETDSILCNLLL